MKTLLFIPCLLLPFNVFSQKLTQYKASNGKTYHIGDTVKIALGSMSDGDFKFVQAAPLLPMPPHRGSTNSLNAHKDFSNTNAIIRKIKNTDQDVGGSKIVFNVKTTGLVTYDVWIEEAIAVCEVTPCAGTKAATGPQLGIADELLKLKKLLDAGAITQSEYDAQKKKLLAQ
jgi:hypothetical protein